MSDQFPILWDYSERRAASLSGVILRRSVPLAMVAPHERQAMSNHDQTLQRLAERGGLGEDELCAVLEDRRWRKMDPAEASARLAQLVAGWSP